MRYLAVCLLFATLAWAQEKSSQSPTQSDVPPEYQPPVMRDNDEKQALPESASKVGPNAAVITIKGLCEKSSAASTTTCQTVITRAQFERLTDALLTNMKFSMQHQIADAYPNLLAMATAAEARGVDKSQRFQERIAFARIQILSQELVKQIDKESSQIPDKDLEDYYHTHAAEFELATLERVFIPNRKRTNSTGSEESMTQLSEQLRSRAVAGDAFMTLQKEAYTAAAMTDVPPNPSLGQTRVSSFPHGHASVFDLKPGEVSNVLSDSTGHYIYKVDAKETVAFDKAKNDIHKILQNQRREEAIRAVQSPITTELNPAYFGPTETSTNPRGPKSK